MQQYLSTSSCPGARADVHPAEKRFRQFVDAKTFPCVGAKSANNRNRLKCAVVPRLAEAESTQLLHDELRVFANQNPDPGLEPISFAALFLEGGGDDSASFHEQLWRQLQLLHELDREHFDWAADVSSDVTAPEFSFSVVGRAFFVVGLHPQSPRLARRAPHPTLVFNFHEQFDALKAVGRYQKMQAAIRHRDMALQGDINPSLADFGNSSEARQYSGHHGARCPFHSHN